MAPFSMKCLTCGEFIYRGRKFNARKVTDQAQRYLNIQIYQFHIKCTRCSAEITFRTDPKNNDYAMVSGAMRNMEPWRDRGAADESLEDRLDRLEREEAEALTAEVHEADDGLEQHVTDRDAPQLFLELRPQLLLGRLFLTHRVASPQGAASAAPAVA